MFSPKYAGADADVLHFGFYFTLPSAPPVKTGSMIRNDSVVGINCIFMLHQTFLLLIESYYSHNTQMNI